LVGFDFFRFWYENQGRFTRTTNLGALASQTLKIHRK